MNLEPEKAELAKVVPINDVLNMNPPTEEEMKWYESTKKVDANDIVAELGPERAHVYILDLIRKAPIVYLNPSKIRSFRELRHYYPELREPVIDGLLRRGEILNIVSSSKKGKSYLGLGLAMSIIQGAQWLSFFQCAQGPVLIIDNELHKETCVDRTRKVADHLGIRLEYVDQWLDYLPLRGELLDIFTLMNELKEIRKGEYRLIVLDALYRFMPQNFDENDNGAMAKVFNQLDFMAKELDSAIVLIHHTSKGYQGGKSVTDVGAGAGAQSRAADAHLVLREIPESTSIRLDAANRSFPPPKPFCIKFKHPVWEIDKDTDPEQLNNTKADRRKEISVAAKEEVDQSIEKILLNITEPRSLQDIIDIGVKMGVPRWGRFKADQQIKTWLNAGKLRRATEKSGSKGATYVVTTVGQESSHLPNTPQDQQNNSQQNSQQTDSELEVPF